MLYHLAFVCHLASGCVLPPGFDDLIFTDKPGCETMATAFNGKERFAAGVEWFCSEATMFHASTGLPILPNPSTWPKR